MEEKFTTFTSGKYFLRRGRHILFGMYPQREVSDPALVAVLNKQIEESFPSQGSYDGWAPCEFTDTEDEPSLMWYKDIFFGNKLYRAVYIEGYKPYFTDFPKEPQFSQVAENDFDISKTYWFEFMPLEWTVLKEKDNRLLLLCDRIIDAQAFKYRPSYKALYRSPMDAPLRMELYANNWEHSTVRKWLNSIFINTAFDTAERMLIPECESMVEHQELSAEEPHIRQYCEITKDRVSLPSFEDIVNREYGFMHESYEYERKRVKTVTDYARCQGVESNYWMLRSPEYNSDMGVMYVTSNGVIDTKEVKASDIGIAPLILIKTK